MSGTVRWWWVRHAPTHASALAGWTDVRADLSDRARIERLAALIPGDATVVSSDLSRAISTADAISGCRLRLPHAEALRELNFGEWEGKTTPEITDSHPEVSASFWRNPRSASPPGGEDWEHLFRRTSGYADSLSDRLPGRSIVAVAHFGTILTQIERSAPGGLHEALKYGLEHLSVTRIDRSDGEWRLIDANRLP